MKKTVFAVLFCLSAASLSVAQHWEFEQVDTTSGFRRLRLGVSSDERIHACYSDNSGVFRYACKDTCWHREEFIAPAVATWDFAVSRDGRAGLLEFVDSLVLIERTDTGWVADVLPLPIWSTTRNAYHLAYDTSGEPAIAYYFETYDLRCIKYACRRESEWTNTDVGQGGGLYCWPYGPADLQVNPENNRAAIIHAIQLWRLNTTSAFASMQDDSGRWTRATVAERPGDATIRIWSAAPRYSGGAVPCYGVGPNRDSMFCGERLVTTQVVQSVVLQVDTLDQERLAYRMSDKLVYTWRDGAVWSEETVMTAGVASLGGIALDALGEPLVALLDSSGLPWIGHRVRAEHDVGVARIAVPPETTAAGAVVTPAVVVKNFGRSLESLTVVLGLSPGFTDSAVLGGLGPGDSAVVCFREWAAGDTDAVYDAKSFTILPGDGWNANDTAARVVVVRTSGGVEENASWACPRVKVTIVQGVLMMRDSRQKTEYRAELLDVGGRKVLELQPGENDVSHLAPGVYFVGEAQAQARTIRKVVLTR